jgi:hypothetical protein
MPDSFISSPASMKKGMATRVTMSTPATMVCARMFRGTSPRMRR